MSSFRRVYLSNPFQHLQPIPALCSLFRASYPTLHRILSSWYFLMYTRDETLFSPSSFLPFYTSPSSRKYCSKKLYTFLLAPHTSPYFLTQRLKFPICRRIISARYHYGVTWDVISLKAWKKTRDGIQPKITILKNFHISYKKFYRLMFLNEYLCHYFKQCFFLFKSFLHDTDTHLRFYKEKNKK